ncbi:hypothetical protein [Pseudofrankia sp. BMG5.36]|uniref:hypothetical protein n=1 Tax=Pseudofrankia sp. BMG5.36 TaxID=1834512 RepID=UPI0008D951B8|nr:hypothetical protein [Pseudofrankia sp. BMG5.36]OHV75227.1 hypothetical protein BCD48_00400 [Pseudofrankia sp. BMG5.36]
MFTTVALMQHAEKAQVAQSNGMGGMILLTIVTFFGLAALITGLTRHIGHLWGIAAEFLRPMMAAVKTLLLVVTVVIVFLVGLAGTAHHEASPQHLLTTASTQVTVTVPALL